MTGPAAAEDRQPTSVAIMTMHRIHNYGSTLQAYGLQRLVETIAPRSSVSFVDFHPGPVLENGHASRGSSLMRNLGKLIEYNQTKTPVRDRVRFFNHKRTYGRNYLAPLGIPRTPNYARDVDVQIVGSDEVFNCVQSNMNVGFSRDLFGHDAAASTLATYAASFGNTTWEKLEATGVAAEVADGLRRFHHLSVRDAHSRELVERLTGRSAQLHVDPVLAYPFMTAEERVPRRRLSDRPYIIVYGYSGRLSTVENRALRDYARARGADILSFGGVQECADRFIDCSPFELLAFFRDTLGVVTDTFHGTIFSIINHKPFGTIVRPSVGRSYGNEEKLSYLLSFLGLQERRVGPGTALGELLHDTPEYGPVDEKLSLERRRTNQYLAQILQAERT